MTNKRLALALLFSPLLLAGCSGSQPIATAPASGVTASNGGGQRALGDIPNVGVTNGHVTETTTRNGAGPRSY